jgi:hypothetical protein
MLRKQHNVMIKALVRFMMVTLLCSVSLFSFGYAQEECDVCGSTADAFQTYLDAMEQSIEVLNAIILAKSAVQDPITIDASQYAKIDQTFNDQMNEILIDVASPD